MQDIIVDVRVPLEEVIELKEDTKKVMMRKLYPGYVLVKMVMSDESWYVVRNTRGVTGFVGPQSKAIPLTEDEVLNMGIEVRTLILSYDVGDTIKISDGPLSGFLGTVEEISADKNKVKVIVSMFGRETPVELDIDQVETID